MPDMNRRSFLKASAAGAAGLTLGSSLLRGSTLAAVAAQEATPATHTFFVEPGMVSELSADLSQVLNYSAWGVPSELKPLVDAMPYGVVPNLDNIQAWLDQRTANCVCDGASQAMAANATELDQLMGLQLTGLPNMMDLAGVTASSIVANQPLDLSLDVLHQAVHLQQEHRVHLPVVTQPVTPANAATSIAAGQAPPFVEADGSVDATFYRTIGMFGWRFKLRGAYKAPMGACAPEPTRHVVLEISRMDPETGEYHLILTVRFGSRSSKNGREFILYSEQKPQTCWRSAKPSWNELFGMIKTMVMATAARLGHYLPLWLVASIGAVVTLVLFIPILLLTSVAEA